jgi:hypothetical protein
LTFEGKDRYLERDSIFEIVDTQAEKVLYPSKPIEESAAMKVEGLGASRRVAPVRKVCGEGWGQVSSVDSVVLQKRGERGARVVNCVPARPK